MQRDGPIHQEGGISDQSFPPDQPDFHMPELIRNLGLQRNETVFHEQHIRYEIARPRQNLLGHQGDRSNTGSNPI